MSRFLLDTSAVLAWLRGEPGKERVRELLQGESEVLLPWPALMESYYSTLKIRGKSIASERHATLRALPVQILEEIDLTLYLLAGEFKAAYSISFADALVAAYAFRHDAILVHKDPEFEALTAEIKMEALPYKPTGKRSHR